MKISSILGLNARTQIYSYPYNTARGKKIAASKILTHRILKKFGVPSPVILKIFREPRDIVDFEWKKLADSFVLKPSKGYGGEGIIVVKSKLEDGKWLTTQKNTVTVDDLKLHILDILEGAYSIGNVPDVAFIQEYVPRHYAFRKYAFRGTPDIRVIIFNKVPVMAMLRLPTKESGGRANLHQGAIGVGIDLATGITTRATLHDNEIKYKPGSTRKLNGVKIPGWTKILETAVRAQIVSGLGYVGVDIVLHPTDGPMVLEINSQPGLRIQLANREGLRKRLERVEDLVVRDHEHGVKIAKALFAGRFADRVAAEEGIKTINVWENIKMVAKDGTKQEITAKVDTGAWRTSIDRELAKNLGLLTSSNILWSKKFKSGLGTEEREVINLQFYLAGRKIKTIASLANRSSLRTPVIIGRRDLGSFLIKPQTEKGFKQALPALWKK